MRAPLLLLLAGCLSELPLSDTAPATEADELTAETDADGDGYAASEDCDDGNSDVHPGQAESCDGLDNNCNGLADEGSQDTDGDGTADCVDVEECDGLDNNGDGLIDEGASDSDGDGTADCIDIEECDGLDNNGDGLIDEDFDLDGDGVAPCGSLPDCDDTDADSHPGAAERSDGRDNDCDDLTDEDDLIVGDLVITELMVNPAALSDPLGEWIEVANTSDGVRYLGGLTLSTDTSSHTITDSALTIEPGAVVLLGASGALSPVYTYEDLSLSNEGGTLTLSAEGRLIDTMTWNTQEGGGSWSLDPLAWSAEDNDEGAWWCVSSPSLSGADAGSPGAENEGCPSYDHDGDGFSGDQGDCDDTDAEVYPGAEDAWYDGVDSDCDGWQDDDADHDGHGIAAGDCDDTDATIYPGAEEWCDGVDSDCDGLTDEDAADGERFYADSDGDGHGDEDSTTWACTLPSGYAELDDDCDDSSADTSPSADEVCDDDIDDDCDGAAQFCDEAGHEIGDNDWNWSASDYYRGNIYYADSDEQLLRYEVYLDLPEEGCELEFIVFSADSLTGSWTQEWSATVESDRSGWVSSGGIELSTVSGTWYSLGVGWSCSASYYAGYGSFTGDDGGIGGFAGNHYDNAYSTTSSFIPSSTGAGSFAYAQVVYVAE
jgi:hypothetical protein